MIPNLLQEQFIWSPLGRNSGMELAHPSMVQFVPAQMLHCKQKNPTNKKDSRLRNTAYRLSYFSPFQIVQIMFVKIKSHCQTSLDWSSCVKKWLKLSFWFKRQGCDFAEKEKRWQTKQFGICIDIKNDHFDFQIC